MRDLFDLTDRVAVITGGVGVLGLQFAHALAERGAHIVLADLDQTTCDQCAAKIGAEYETASLGIACDVAKPEDVARLVDRTMAEYGRIDVLVNNAATQPPGFFTPLEEYSLDAWNEVLAVNLTGMFLVAQAVGKVMVNQKKGSIINIASIYGIGGPDHRVYAGCEFNTPAAYAVSKAGVIGLTKYLATYWADKGVRVSAITPGGVYRNHEDPFLSAYEAHVPMGRMAEEHEISGAVVYLASDASSYVTGHNLIVDGGWTAW